MRLGVHENYQGPKATSFGRTAAAFPLTSITREFEADPMSPQDLVRRMVARCQEIWEAGRVAVWSFKPNPADVKSGAWERDIKALATYITNNGLQSRVIVVFWHEPENDVPKHFKNAADFVRVFNQCHDWLTEADPTIVTSHAALGYAYRNWTVAQARAWTTKATIHSIDLYSGRSFPLGMTLGNSKAFKTWKASRAYGVRWGVSERGWIADDSRSEERAASIDAEAEYLDSLAPEDKPDFYIVWNTEGVENDPKIILDAAGRDAVNRMFARLSQTQCPVCNGTGRVPPVA